MGKNDAKIAAEFERLKAARAKSGTVADLARKWGLSRQRLYEIVDREKKRRTTQ